MSDQKYNWKRVWDMPTRLFHWALVATVGIGWWLGDNLSFENISWHFYLGYATGGLVLFRIIWGFIGSRSARLSSLFHRPEKVISYIGEMKDRTPSGYPGHSPVGSLSVLALLTSLIVQVVTGLFTESDDFFDGGPLAGYVDSQLNQLANEIHDINSSILLFLIGAHLAAIAFYLIWKKENLVRAMITGQKLLKRESSEE